MRCIGSANQARFLLTTSPSPSRFVYGLSKFHTDSFDAEVQFAFRLFDLDGSGALEPHEALIVLRDALRSELVGGVAEELSRTQEGHLKKVLEEVVQQTGREVLGPTEFAMVCIRAPRVYLSAKLLYQKLCKLSKDPCKVVMALSPEARHKLLAQSGRVSMHLSSAQSSGQVQQQPHFGADALSKSVYKPTPKRIMEPPPMSAPLVIPGYATLLAHRESETRRLDVPRASSSAKLGGRGGGEPGVAGQIMNGQASGVSSRPQSPMLPPAGAGPGGPRQSQAGSAPPRQSQAAGAPLAPHLANGGGGGQRPQSAGRPPSGGGAANGSRRLSAQTGR